MFGVTDPAIETSVKAYVKLVRASRAVTARVVGRLNESDLTPNQLGVLEALLHLGPLTQRDLGRKILTSPGNLTDVIDKLERRKLVHRTICPEDRRSVRVALTEEGRMLIESVFPLHAADIHQAMSPLSLDELTILSHLLRRLGQEAANRSRSNADS